MHGSRQTYSLSGGAPAALRAAVLASKDRIGSGFWALLAVLEADEGARLRHSVEFDQRESRAELVVEALLEQRKGHGHTVLLLHLTPFAGGGRR